NGFDEERYKQGSLLNDIQQRAKDAGVSIDPIPWDKVNKVYSAQEIKPLQH
ncbi:nitroreductase, partial [Vibrio sp. V11_P1A41T118]